jgi:DNA-binding winged helix-turn-helix (wHTH) protein
MRAELIERERISWMGDCRGERLGFGEFEFDCAKKRLYRGGRQVKIQPQPLRVLAVLLERDGEIVSREDLRARV